LAEVSDSLSAASRVRSELMNMHPCGPRGAVVAHKQVRSEVANKISPAMLADARWMLERRRLESCG
jgi:hypothetical protein